MQLTQGYVSGDSTLVNDDSENSNGPATTTRRGIRKARSSGNIRNNMDYNNADRPVSRLTIDRIPIKQSIFTTTIKRIVGVIQQGRGRSESKEKPNLPSVSRSNSHRNSYIGLNRLKDNNLSKQNNNLYYNLKQLGKGPNNQELIKNWNKKEKEY